MKGDAEKYRAAGMSDYVSKPIEREKLNAAIQRQCGTRLEVQELPAASIRSAEPEIAAADLQDELDEIFSDMDSDLSRPIPAVVDYPLEHRSVPCPASGNALSSGQHQKRQRTGEICHGNDR